MTESKPIKVLFLCTGNACRSQMAEAWLRTLGGDSYRAFSAGLEPHGVNPYTVTVMEELGVDMSAHRSKYLTEFLTDADFNYLITVCGNADERCPYFPGMGTRLHWPFQEPAAMTGTEAEILAAFRDVRDQIKTKIQTWLDEIEQ